MLRIAPTPSQSPALAGCLRILRAQVDFQRHCEHRVVDSHRVGRGAFEPEQSGVQRLERLEGEDNDDDEHYQNASIEEVDLGV